jgi:putative ABC transport system ATP-binding protein
MCHLKLKKENL